MEPCWCHLRVCILFVFMAWLLFLSVTVARLLLFWRDFLLFGATFFHSARLFFIQGDFFCIRSDFFIWRNFFLFDAIFFIRRDFFSLARLFFIWRDFFYSARLFLFGATFLLWRDFLMLLIFLSRAQTLVWSSISATWPRLQWKLKTILRRQVFDIIHNKTNNLLPASYLHVIWIRIIQYVLVSFFKCHL